MSTPLVPLFLFTLALLSLTPFATALPAPNTTNLYTNLPPSTPGTFTAQTRQTIRTTLPLAWSALTNLSSYPAWNPFTRSATLLPLNYPLNTTVPPQYPVEGLDMLLRSQIPPLPLPLQQGADTPDNPFNTRWSYEHVTHVQNDLGRLAWIYVPGIGLQSERWQAISDLGNGLVLYESREVFNGPLAGLLRDLMGSALQQGFDAQGRGLMLLLEGGL